MRIEPSDPIPHTEIYSPVSPQVGHKTSVSKQVNWSTWAVIQDCSIPSATRSAAPIISIKKKMRGTHHFRFTQHVFTLIHPHFLLSFRQSTQKHCVMSLLILLPWHLWYWWQYTVSGKKCNFREYLQKYFVNWLSWSDLLTNYQQNGNWVQCIVGRPSVAGVLVLISDWSISESNDVMLVTTPYKEISVEYQGSETAGNLFMVSLGAVSYTHLTLPTTGDV